MRLRALAIAILLATAGAPRLLAQPAADVETATAPVEIDGVTLFHVRGVTSLPAATRAGAIHQRIVAIAADQSVAADSIHATAVDNTYRILAGERLIMAVVEADAALEQVSTFDLATGHAQRIRQAIVDYREARTEAALQRDAVNIAIATAALIVALALVIFGTRRADRYLSERLHQRIKTVGIQSFEVMRAERIWSGLHNLVAGARTMAGGGWRALLTR